MQTHDREKFPFQEQKKNSTKIHSNYGCIMAKQIKKMLVFWTIFHEKENRKKTGTQAILLCINYIIHIQTHTVITVISNSQHSFEDSLNSNKKHTHTHILN